MPRSVNLQQGHPPAEVPDGSVDVAIVIPTLEEEARIGQAVSTARMSGADDVLVVDGGSSDETRTVARQEGVRVLTSAAGRGIQQSTGAQNTTAEVILFQHADTWLSPGAVAQVRQAMRHPDVQLGAFRQKIMADGWLYRCLEFGNAQRLHWGRMPYGDQGIFIRALAAPADRGGSRIPLDGGRGPARRASRYTRPILLPGPIHVDARRWQQRGVLRQTLSNWGLWTAYTLGASPERLRRYYRRP